MVEQKPSKLTTRVRFPSPAPRFLWTIPNKLICPCGSVVEHSLGKGEVTRSIRVMGTSFFSYILSRDVETLIYKGSGVRHGKRQV